MRLSATAMITLALALASAPGGAGCGAARAAEGRPDLAIDEAQLPPLPPVYSQVERTQHSLVAAGVGAVGGVVIADVVTGGLLLAPLGLPTFATLLGGGPPAAAAGAAAVPAPTYTLVQQVLAGVASMVAALGGGYIGMRIAGPPAEP